MRPLVFALLVASRASALEPGAPDQTNSFGAEMRGSVLTGDPAALFPRIGFGFGAHARWFYRPSLGLMLDGAYDRWGDPRDNRVQLSRASFGLEQVLARAIGPVVPWIGAGGAIVIAIFRDSSTGTFRAPDGTMRSGFLRDPTRADAMKPALRGSAGVGFEVTRGSLLGVEVGYDHVFGSPTVRDLPAARTLRIVEDTVHVALTGEVFF